MTAPEQPQIYLISPPQIELSTFPDLLAKVLDAQPIACMRLALATQDEDRLSRAADACRAVAHARDVPIVIADHIGLVDRLGLDGVHFAQANASVRAARKDLGPDPIVGAFCGASRHDGMDAGEAGADYIAFGPTRDGGLGTAVAAPELFGWWSEMIELPVVAEGLLDTDVIAQLTPVTDFFALGEEVWSTDDPVAALRAIQGAIANA